SARRHSMFSSYVLEGVLDVQADIVAITAAVVLTSTIELGVLDLSFQAVQVTGTHTQSVRLATFDKVTSLVRVTFKVIFINRERRDVYTCINVVPSTRKNQGIAVGVLVDLVFTVIAGDIRA